MLNKWFETLLESGRGRGLWLLLGIAALAALMVVAGDVAPTFETSRLLALLPLLAGVLPLVGIADDDEDDETAKTIVAMPAFMADELQKEKARIEAERAARKKEAEAQAEFEDAPETARTMAFSPADAAAFKEAAAAYQKPPVQEAEPPAPAQTMAFSPAESEAFRAGAAKPPAADEDMGTAATVMFDAREAGLDKLTADKIAQPVDIGEDETGAYSAADVERMRDMMTKAREGQVPESDEAVAGTMAYMPAMSQEMAETRDAAPPVEEDEGEARTVAYMPAVDVSSQTAAYSPEDKQRLLDSLAEGKSPQEAMDAVASTQAYSPEQSAALREAFELLEQVKSGAGGNSQVQAEARQLLENAHQTDPGLLRRQAEDLLSRTGEIRVPKPVAKAPSPGPTSDFGVEEKSGMGTVPLIIILILLLALAGGATAFILHFLGLIDLPVDLPQLDLFSKS